MAFEKAKKAMTKGVIGGWRLVLIVNSIIVSQSKGTLMWQVIATDGTRERQVVTSRWTRANHLARKALDMGWKVKIKTVFADVIVTNIDGDFLIIAKKIRVRDATSFTSSWMKNCYPHPTGCMLWPHGASLPKRWKVLTS